MRAFDGMKLSQIIDSGALKRHKRDAEFDACLNAKMPDGNFIFNSYLNCVEDYQRREGDDPCVRENEIAMEELKRRRNKHGFWEKFGELYKWFG